MLPQIIAHPLPQLASGDRLSLQTYCFKGSTPGQKAYIQANLHGAEIVGNAVIQRLLTELGQLESEYLVGEIWLVPTCNPLAVNQRTHYFATGRYNPTDGKDWNRIFWDYEQETTPGDLESFARTQVDLEAPQIEQNYRQRILEAFRKECDRCHSPEGLSYNELYRCCLQSLCLDANYVLDLHSSSNRGTDHVFCFASREDSAATLLFDWGILMHDYEGYTFDEAFLKPWLALEKKLAALGKNLRFDVESWTLELGSGMEANPASVERGTQGILNYLVNKGMLKLAGYPKAIAQPIRFIVREDVRRYYAPVGGTIQQRPSLGETVKAGDRLYSLLQFNREGMLPTTIEVPAQTDGIVFDLATSSAVNQGEYVLSLISTS